MSMQPEPYDGDKYSGTQYHSMNSSSSSAYEGYDIVCRFFFFLFSISMIFGFLALTPFAYLGVIQEPYQIPQIFARVNGFPFTWQLMMPIPVILGFVLGCLHLSSRVTFPFIILYMMTLGILLLVETGALLFYMFSGKFITITIAYFICNAGIHVFAMVNAGIRIYFNRANKK